MTHAVRNDEANVRDSKVAKKGITRVGIEKVMKACCLTKYLSMNLHTHNIYTRERKSKEQERRPQVKRYSLEKVFLKNLTGGRNSCRLTKKTQNIS